MTLETRTHSRQSPGGRLAVLMSKGLSDSRRLGHRPGMPTPDVVGHAALTACRDCGRFVCVDLMEHDEPFGSGTTEPCHWVRGRRR